MAQSSVNHRSNFVISVTVYEFHVTERQCPLPKALLPVLKSKINAQENWRAQ
jgi:hypothetical protein